MWHRKLLEMKWKPGKSIWACLLAILCLSACASTPDGKPPSTDWPFEPMAIKLKFKADTMLNLDEGKQHTLALCVYQLKNGDAFTDLAKDAEGVARLLSCTSFSDTVTGLQRIFVHPGEMKIMTMDRAKHTQFVGVVLGYASYLDTEPQKAALVYEIPLRYYQEGFLWWKENYRWPQPLLIDLFLGPKEAKDLEKERKDQQAAKKKASPGDQAEKKEKIEVKIEDATPDDDRK